MPHVEVIPTTTAKLTPGWTYVADTGAKAPIAPTGPRQRAARTNLSGGGSAQSASRQNAAIARRIAELERDNSRDVVIPVPVRHRDGANRGRWSFLEEF